MKAMLSGVIVKGNPAGVRMQLCIQAGSTSLPRRCARLLIGLLGIGCALAQTPAQILVDATAFDASADASIEVAGQNLRLTWPVSSRDSGELVLNLNPAPNQPLI